MEIEWAEEIAGLLSLLDRETPDVEGALSQVMVLKQRLELLDSSNRVLIMDDNKELLDLVRDVLGTQGFEVVCVPDGDSVLQELKNHSRYHFHAVVLDLIIEGGRGGLAILSEIHEFRSDLSIILSSGHPTEFEIFNDSQRFRFLHKPWRIREITEVLNDECERTRSRYYMNIADR